MNFRPPNSPKADKKDDRPFFSDELPTKLTESKTEITLCHALSKETYETQTTTMAEFLADAKKNGRRVQFWFVPGPFTNFVDLLTSEQQNDWKLTRKLGGCGVSVKTTNELVDPKITVVVLNTQPLSEQATMLKTNGWLNIFMADISGLIKELDLPVFYLDVHKRIEENAFRKEGHPFLQNRCLVDFDVNGKGTLHAIPLDNNVVTPAIVKTLLTKTNAIQDPKIQLPERSSTCAV